MVILWVLLGLGVPPGGLIAIGDAPSVAWGKGQGYALSLQKTNDIDPRTATELGRFLGAALMVVGSITEAGAEYIINARQVSVETAAVVQAVSVPVDRGASASVAWTSSCRASRIEPHAAAMVVTQLTRPTGGPRYEVSCQRTRAPTHRRRH
jgi:hypothetical protein